MMGTSVTKALNAEKDIAPLAVLRIAFGAILLISTIRFLAKGWVREFYIAPSFHFPFYGFEWVRPLSAAGMYFVFGIMLLSSLFVLLGLFYRVSVTAFLISFSYVELLDKTFYLNHYYFVSVFTFLLLLAPAHRYFSLDVMRKPSIRTERVPAWTIYMFQAQVCLVYFYAGLSKLTPDWMMEAMPLRIWLPANTGIPLIGPLLGQLWVSYLFSWVGALFDLSVGPLLLWKPSRRVTYLVVVLFHLMTALLFKIGMFPYIMIAATVIFFSEGWHRRVLRAFGDRRPLLSAVTAELSAVNAWALGIFFLLQILIPLRYLLYPGRLFWTEEGYRFSWRVMLMEKSGTDFFYVKDPVTGRRGEIITSRYLTPLQERQMATQPDMILQYAHYLHDLYRQKWAAGPMPGTGAVHDPVVTVESYVTLNGSGSRLYIDSTVDLAKQSENFYHKTWILPFTKNK
jgi:hypothetical protein